MANESGAADLGKRRDTEEITEIAVIRAALEPRLSQRIYEVVVPWLKRYSLGVDVVGYDVQYGPIFFPEGIQEAWHMLIHWRGLNPLNPAESKVSKVIIPADIHMPPTEQEAKNYALKVMDYVRGERIKLMNIARPNHQGG